MELDLKEYKLIVESSPNMIWRAGTDGKCHYFNQNWLKFTNRTLEQEFGNGWAEGVHADDLNRCMKIFMDAFVRGESFEMEYRCVALMASTAGLMIVVFPCMMMIKILLDILVVVWMLQRRLRGLC